MLLLFCVFGTVNAQRPYHAEEHFGVIHNAVEVFAAGAHGVKQHIVSGMYFLGFFVRNVARCKFAFQVRVGAIIAGAVGTCLNL